MLERMGLSECELKRARFAFVLLRVFMFVEFELFF